MALNQDVRRVDEEDVKYIQALPVAYHEVNSDDEINLLDLWLVIIKRKNLFFVVLLLSLLCGFSYVLFKPQNFNFSTIVEIGNKFQQGDFVPVEESASVLAKINRAYIFLASVQYLEEYPGKIEAPEITASLGKGTSIIELTIKGVAAEKEVYFRLLTQITDKIIQRHKQIISVAAANLEQLKSKIKVNIDSIGRRQDLSGEEKVSIINDFNIELSSIEMKMANLRETQVIVKPAQSIKPVGQSKKLILVVSFVIGFFAALFAVFFFEFMEKARNYSAEKNQST